MLSQISSKEDLSLRILGIDPGTNSLGMSLGICDFKTPAYDIEFAETFNMQHLIYKSNLYVTDYLSRNLAMYKSTYELTYQMVADLTPDLVICETPYMDRRFPLPYMLLSICTQAIQHAVKDYTIFLPFEGIDPATAKNGVGVKGNSNNKEHMREAILNNPHIRSHLNLAEKDEHSIDSIAIGYNGFLGVLNA